ncbi:hypothetical protein KVR01_011247 [Diaporthe batatas]|uniref:uncharacterized protein n=1 Tax=Diaporthe batatas TaxID=748121 RepID=UPI001D03C5D0|nr:uncharacterized protein KVR01_011247 [Diaporthe batatas]KAG8158804.1 hypothetical protein KVR01_011247 [Diaporthe batatas]
MNSNQEWQLGPPRLKPVGPTTCGFCEARFPSIDALRAHKLKRIKEESEDSSRRRLHLYCKLCDQDFHTTGGELEHMRLVHPHKQDFECPACSVKHDRLSGFIQHVELGQCCQLDIETLQARFADKFNFAKNLQKLDLAARLEFPNLKEKDFSMCLGYDADPEPTCLLTGSRQEVPNKLSQWESADRNTWASAEPAPSLGKDFPRMAHREYLHGNSDATDLLTGDQVSQLDGAYDTNAWARKEKLFPESRPAQRPTQEQLQALKAGNQGAVERVRGQDIIDPNSPFFNPQQCWNELLQKYKCPHKAVCQKAFNTMTALMQHLRSANHSGTKFSCPCCKDRFNFLYALAAHVESPSRKCSINSEFDEQDMYRIFLDQLTLGMVECGGIFDDNTQEFKLDDKFKGLYEPQETRGPTFGHKQVHGFESAAGPADTVRSDLTEAALGKYLQQLGKEGGGPRGSGPAVALTAEALARLQAQEKRASPEVALTAEALARLQAQEKRASPWGQTSSAARDRRDNTQQREAQAPPPQQQQQQQKMLQPGEGIETPVPERYISYRKQQFEAFGWDTWDKGPVPREEDQGRLANSKKRDWGW